VLRLGLGAPSKSLVGVVSLAPAAEAEAGRPQVVGWEKNGAGKMGARMADLAPMMDPVRCGAPPPARAHG
jgi:ubiquitin-like modifier-activating enzyme ATG7